MEYGFAIFPIHRFLLFLYFVFDSNQVFFCALLILFLEIFVYVFFFCSFLFFFICKRKSGEIRKSVGKYCFGFKWVELRLMEKAIMVKVALKFLSLVSFWCFRGESFLLWRKGTKWFHLQCLSSFRLQGNILSGFMWFMRWFSVMVLFFMFLVDYYLSCTIITCVLRLQLLSHNQIELGVIEVCFLL